MRKPCAGPYAEPCADYLMRSLMGSLVRSLALNLRNTKIHIRETLPAQTGHDVALMRALVRPLCGPYAGPLGWAGPKGRAHWARPNGPSPLGAAQCFPSLMRSLMRKPYAGPYAEPYAEAPLTWNPTSHPSAAKTLCKPYAGAKTHTKLIFTLCRPYAGIL